MEGRRPGTSWHQGSDSASDHPHFGTDPTHPDGHAEPLGHYTSSRFGNRSGRPSHLGTARRFVLAGLAVALVVALLVSSLAVVAALRGPGGQRGSGTTASGTAAADATPQATAAGYPTATPPTAPYACANAASSTRTYVFLNADHQLYRVSGCSTPVQLTHLDSATSVDALAFSPTNRRLMVRLSPTSAPESGGPPMCLALLNPQTGALTRTTFCEASGVYAGYPMARFIAWVDDDTFLEAEFEQPTTGGTSAVKVLRVDATTLASTPIRTLTWVANTATYDTDTGMRLRGGSLYYGGYVSASEGGAWLHRLSLADGTDSQLVKLGLAGTGGCQVYEGPCNWTGWWDISATGSRIVYHTPGPTISLSDTANPPDTPLYIANPDGSAALKLTSPPVGATIHFLSAPALAPSGAWVTAPNSNGDTVLLATDGSGTTIALPAGYQFRGWRPDSTAALLTTQGPTYTQAYAVYTLATRSLTRLGTYTGGYVWGV